MNPFVRRPADLDLRGHVGAGPGARRGQSRPGLPRFRLARRRRRQGGRGADRRSNQYPPMRGLAELREAVARPLSRATRASTLDADQVIVTSGATEAIAASLLALVAPGDEVVLFQPLYDAYLPLVLRAGGVPRLVRLTPPGLADHGGGARRGVHREHPPGPVQQSAQPDRAGVRRATSWRCSPRPASRHDAVAISDEVWEHVLFDGRAHVPLAALPGMAERTVKIGSAGKIFSLTGWKVGWAVAPPPLAAAIAKAHQFVTFATAAQSAERGRLRARQGRRLLRGDARRLRRRPRPAARGARGGRLCGAAGRGHLFPRRRPRRLGDRRWTTSTFCERAVREAGVAAIPVSAFYAEEPVTNVIRLCFAKQRRDARGGGRGAGQARGAVRRLKVSSSQPVVLVARLDEAALGVEARSGGRGSRFRAGCRARRRRCRGSR